MAMTTRGEALRNADLNRSVTAQQSAVNSGKTKAASAAASGVSAMNSQDMSLPSLDDFT